MANNMNIEFLISTMFKKNISLVYEMNIKSDSIIINQSDFNEKNKYQLESGIANLISTTDRGLSKSRNLALNNASGDICVICDDDLRYYDNCVETIQNAYLRNPKADIIVFCYRSKGRQNKAFYNKSKKLNYIDSMKVSSVQVTFKRNSILGKNISFNELFGTGSTSFQAGEENIFLSECLKKGLKIYFEPVYILDVMDDSDSTWFNGYNEKYMFDRGAIFTAMSKKLGLPLILQFAIRKHRIYKDSISFYKTLQLMLEGRKYYLERQSDSLS